MRAWRWADCGACVMRCGTVRGLCGTASASSGELVRWQRLGTRGVWRQEWGFWGGGVDGDYSEALTRLHDGSAACGSESLRREAARYHCCSFANIALPATAKH